MKTVASFLKVNNYLSRKVLGHKIGVNFTIYPNPGK